MIGTTGCANSDATDDKSDQSEESARNIQRHALSHICVDSRYFDHFLADVEPLDDDDDICRICHEKSTPDLPFITPCSCTGSQRYVHQSCLMRWIKTSKMPRCYICNFKYIMSFSFKYFLEWDLKELFPRNRCSDLYMHLMWVMNTILSVFAVMNILQYLKNPETKLCAKPYLRLWLNCTLSVLQHTAIVIIFSGVFLHSVISSVILGNKLCRRWNVFCLVVSDAPKNNNQAHKKVSSNSEITVKALAESDEIRFVHTELEEVSQDIPESADDSLVAFTNSDTGLSDGLQKDVLTITEAETGTAMIAVPYVTPCSEASKDVLHSVLVI